MVDVVVQRITGQTKLSGVFGWPVGHSLSPAMHNAAFGALGLDWVYIPMPVEPDNLPAAVSAIRALGFHGVNVTVPHKEAMLALVDDLTPEARAIGAVNTVLVDGCQLTGHNTDAVGFERTLQRVHFEPAGKRALVLGAGGAARAVVFSLLRSGAEVILLNRTLARAEQLLAAMGGKGTADTLDGAAAARWADRVQLVVNTTSLGMWPHADDNPWPAEVSFPAEALLCDLVYNPRRTRLVAQAESVGARFVDGLWMLVYQGAESLRLWTGLQADVELMYRAADDQLGGQHAAISDRR